MALRFFADHCVSNLIIESLAAASLDDKILPPVVAR
jgi:hypothetical protein